MAKTNPPGTKDAHTRVAYRIRYTGDDEELIGRFSNGGKTAILRPASDTNCTGWQFNEVQHVERHLTNCLNEYDVSPDELEVVEVTVQIPAVGDEDSCTPALDFLKARETGRTEAKADKAKADKAKADEAKADEAKADEAKPAKKTSAAKKAAKKAAAKKAAADAAAAADADADADADDDPVAAARARREARKSS